MRGRAIITRVCREKNVRGRVARRSSATTRPWKRAREREDTRTATFPREKEETDTTTARGDESENESATQEHRTATWRNDGPLSLAYGSASTTLRSDASGWKWRAVSTMSPRCAKRGASVMSHGAARTT